MLRNKMRNGITDSEICSEGDPPSLKLRRGKARVGKRSLSVVIPADIARELGIRERQKLVLRRSGKKIIIEDWEK